MELFTDLKKIYSENMFDFLTDGIHVVEELEKGAGVKKAIFKYQGRILHIKHEFVKKNHSCFNSNSDAEVELDHDCDGVFILQKQNMKYLIFVELKSKYTSSNIPKAEKQIIATYFKIILCLLNFNVFNKNKYKLCGIIVSHPMSSNDKSQILKKKGVKESSLSRYEKQALCFAETKKKSYNIDSRYSRLNKLPIRTEILFTELPVFHCAIPVNSTEGTFDLDDILSKI